MQHSDVSLTSYLRPMWTSKLKPALIPLCVLLGSYNTNSKHGLDLLYIRIQYVAALKAKTCLHPSSKCKREYGKKVAYLFGACADSIEQIE